MTKYSVCLSFAGEQRQYVKEVADRLKALDVSHFYDEDMQADLWGKELSEHLDDIYRKESQFCVMFVSRAYVEKMWTIHERRSALARRLNSETEYILPARFDDTELPGLPPSVGFIDLRKNTPTQLAELIAIKCGRAPTHARVAEPMVALPARRTRQGAFTMAVLAAAMAVLVDAPWREVVPGRPIVGAMITAPVSDLTTNSTRVEVRVMAPPPGEGRQYVILEQFSRGVASHHWFYDLQRRESNRYAAEVAIGSDRPADARGTYTLRLARVTTGTAELIAAQKRSLDRNYVLNGMPLPAGVELLDQVLVHRP